MLKDDYDKGLELTKRLLPHLRETLHSGPIVLVEKEHSEPESLLDRRAGIDALVERDGRIYGIALRMQQGRCWATYTLRYKRTSGRETEWTKTPEALAHGAIAPRLTVQGYWDGQHLSYGVALTAELFRWAQEHEAELDKRRADDEGNEFVVIPWSKLDDQAWFRQVDTQLN